MKTQNKLFKFVLISVVYANISGCTNQVCLEEIEDNFVMTEEVALTLSKKALKNLGLDTSKFEPYPYGLDGKFYAHAENNLNEGYVLWHEKGKNTKFEYSVSIEKKGKKIYCDAGKTL
ncbi:hypothetical protein ANRL3_00178 [Anaerolineae bacterium]|nr:hypothetical protein ANRL3_00178 [Anaerolineae bacterium]